MVDIHKNMDSDNGNIHDRNGSMDINNKNDIKDGLQKQKRWKKALPVTEEERDCYEAQIPTSWKAIIGYNSKRTIDNDHWDTYWLKEKYPYRFTANWKWTEDGVRVEKL